MQFDSKWTLTQKGLLVIGIPLLLQVGFFIGFFMLLQQSESMLQKQYHSKEVFGHTNWLYTLMAIKTLAAAGSAVNGDPACAECFKQCTVKINEELKTLEEVLSSDETQFGQLQTVAKLWNENTGTLRDLLTLNQSLSVNERMSQLAQAENNVRNIFIKLKEARHQLAVEERTDRNVSSSPLEWRNLLKTALTIGLTISVLSALMIFTLYTNRIIRRLKVLSENSTRLAKNDRLLPRIPGNDEISELDRTFHDMATALTSAKDELQRNEQRLFSIIETMPIGLVTLNRSGTIDFANSSLRQILSLEPDATTERNIENILPLQFPQVVDLSEQSTKLEVHCGSEEQPLTVEVSAKSIEISDEQKILLMAQDITERHRLEKLKQDFVAVVSHDLRTPLTSMLAYLSMMERGVYGELNEKGFKRTDAIRRDVDRLMNLVTDILDIERMESGRLSYLFADVTLQELFDQAASAVDELAQTKKISLLAVPTDIGVSGDQDRLMQVLVNLLSNAIKFARSKVSLSARKEEMFVVVEIQDDGRGVPLEAQSLIFERYKQVLHTDQSSGTGLGLPICKSIVEHHGGKIGVTSVPDEGACFWFTLPLK